jgi:small subunit ribosomal protein S16
MVKIRLARRGAKKRPFYHIVIADQRAARDGRYIEHIGFFNPIAAGKDVPMRIDLARVDHWVATGAQMTDRVRDLVRAYRKAPAQEAVAAK